MFQKTHFAVAPQGTNPTAFKLDRPARRKIDKTWLIIGAIVFLGVLCSGGWFLVSKGKAQAEPTATITSTPTLTPTLGDTLEPSPTQFIQRVMTDEIEPSSTPAITQTPWIIYQTSVVTVPQYVEVPVYSTVVVPIVVTQVVYQTVVVTATMTPTPTPTATMEPSQTPTPTQTTDMNIPTQPPDL